MRCNHDAATDLPTEPAKDIINSNWAADPTVRVTSTPQSANGGEPASTPAAAATAQVEAKSVVRGRWRYSMVPEGDGPMACLTCCRTAGPVPLKPGQEVVCADCPEFGEIMEKVIKPYKWHTGNAGVRKTAGSNETTSFNTAGYRRAGDLYLSPIPGCTLTANTVDLTLNNGLRMLVRERIAAAAVVEPPAEDGEPDLSAPEGPAPDNQSLVYRGYRYEGFPKADIDASSTSCHTNGDENFPESYETVEGDHPDFDDIQQNVIAKYTWSTSVVVVRQRKGDTDNFGYNARQFHTPGDPYSGGSVGSVSLKASSVSMSSNGCRLLLRTKIVKPKSQAKPSLCARCGEGFASRVLLFKHLEINPDHESENQIIDNADDDDGADICGAGVKPSCAFRLSPWLQELLPASVVLRVRRAKKGLGGGGSSAGNLVLLAKAKYLSASAVDVFDNEAAARPRARKGKGAGATSAKAAAAAALAPDPGDGTAAAAADGAAAGDGGGGLDAGVSAVQAAADQAAALARAAVAPPVASLEAGCAVQVDPPPRALSFGGLGGLGGGGAAVAAAMGSAFTGSPAPMAAAAAGVSTPYKALGLLGRDHWIPAKPPSGFALSLDTVWPTFANASPSGRTFAAPTKGVSKVSKGGKASKARPAKQAAAARSSSSSGACGCCAPPPDLCDSGSGVCVELAFPSPRSQGTAAGTGFTMYAKGDGFVQAVALPAALLNGGQLVRAEVELAVEANFSGAPLKLGCIVNGVEVGEVTVAAPKGNARTAVRKRG
jgi:hypothetical protein